MYYIDLDSDAFDLEYGVGIMRLNEGFLDETTDLLDQSGGGDEKSPRAETYGKVMTLFVISCK